MSIPRTKSASEMPDELLPAESTSNSRFPSTVPCNRLSPSDSAIPSASSNFCPSNALPCGENLEQNYKTTINSSSKNLKNVETIFYVFKYCRKACWIRASVTLLGVPHECTLISWWLVAAWLDDAPPLGVSFGAVAALFPLPAFPNIAEPVACCCCCCAG